MRWPIGRRLFVATARARRDGAAYLDNGTLTGSTLTMDRAHSTTRETLVGLHRALDMATVDAGQCVGPIETYGVVPASADRADLVALDCATLEVGGVWLAGEPA